MTKYILISIFFMTFPLVVAFGHSEAMAPPNNEYILAEGDAIITNGNTHKPVDCPNPSIKGAVSLKGDKLFYTANSQSYSNVTPKAMFCTTADALASGYTEAPKQ